MRNSEYPEHDCSHKADSHVQPKHKHKEVHMSEISITKHKDIHKHGVSSISVAILGNSQSGTEYIYLFVRLC